MEHGRPPRSVERTWNNDVVWRVGPSEVCEQEELTTIASQSITTSQPAPVSMSHLEQYTDGEWVQPSDELTGTAVFDARSEEHTSELQSHVNLVCRLLLEKKKRKH